MNTNSTIKSTMTTFSVVVMAILFAMPISAQTQDDGSSLDVLVVYTSSARHRILPAGTFEQQSVAMHNLIYDIEDNGNQIFKNSKVTSPSGKPFKYNIVHMEEVNYAESDPNGNVELDDLTDGTGGLNIVSDMQNYYAADQVTLILSDTLFTWAGMGWQASNRTSFDLGYTITRRDQALWNLSFFHEIGHNMGAHHDRAAGDPGPGIDSWACGYTDIPHCFRTIMAYQSGTCTQRKPFWSSSDTSIRYSGYVVGNDSTDNARTLRLSALFASRWRNSQRPNITATHDLNISAGSTSFTIASSNAINGAAQLFVDGKTYRILLTGSAPYTITLGTPAPSSGYALLTIVSRTQSPYRRTVSIGSSPDINGQGTVVRRANNQIESVYASIENAVHAVGAYEKIEVLNGAYVIAQNAEINPTHDSTGGNPVGAQFVEMDIEPGTTIQVDSSLYLNDNGSIHVGPDIKLVPTDIVLVNAEKKAFHDDQVLGIFHSLKRALEVSRPRQTVLLGQGKYDVSEFLAVDESVIGRLGMTRDESSVILLGPEAPQFSFQNDAGMLWKNMIWENNTASSSIYFGSDNANSEWQNLFFVNTASSFPRTKTGLVANIRGGTFKLTNCAFKYFDCGLDVTGAIAPVVTACILDGNNIAIRGKDTTNFSSSNSNNFFNSKVCNLRKGSVDYSDSVQVNTATGGSNRFANPSYVDEFRRDFRLLTSSALIDAARDGQTDIGPFQMNGYFEFADFLDGTITFSDGKTASFADGTLIGLPDPDIILEYKIGKGLCPVIAISRKTKSINITADIQISRRHGARIPNLSPIYSIFSGFMNNFKYSDIPFSNLPAPGTTYTLPHTTPDAIAPVKVADVNITPSSSGNFLQWSASSEPDIVAYKLYRGNPVLDINKMVELVSLDPSATSFLDVSGTASNNYAIVAYDSTGNQSNASYCFAKLPGWSFSKDILFNTTPSGANIVDDTKKLPVLIRLDKSNFNFEEAKGKGEDIRFFDKGGTIPLEYEIACWNRIAKYAEIWVLVPQVDGNSYSDYIEMFWGNSAAISKSNHDLVFSRDNGFLYVCHMSCGQRTCHSECKMVDGSSPFEPMILDYEKGKEFAAQMFSPISASLWGKCHDNKCHGCSKEIPCISGKFTISWWASGKSGDWVYYAYVYDRGIIRYYRNGIQVINEKHVRIPSKSFWEIRIENVARSSQWIKICYENQKEIQTLIEIPSESTAVTSTYGYYLQRD